MDILDKLFSRELTRRTGEHAIKIATVRKKVVKPTARKTNLFQRINIRFPWLKIVAIPALGLLFILHITGVTISKTGDPYDKIKIAPMSHHVRSTNRNFLDKKLVALTFDDGPSAATTPTLLDVLAKKDVLATFFVLGSMAKNNPDIVKRAEKEGHEVASHTMYHQNLIRISGAAVRADIGESKTVYQNILGHTPSYTRPPYGNLNNTVQNSVGTPIILWSVDTLDWQNRDPAAILANTKNQVSDGAIILMHDIYDTSVDAVATLVDELRKDGYEFATISEITKYRNLKLANGTPYRYLK